MTNRLAPIIAQKHREVAGVYASLDAYPNHAIAQVLRGDVARAPAGCFKRALQAEGLSVIAEIKRRSPSKGELAAILDPCTLATTYCSGGASALSILTDKTFFGGSLNDLNRVALTASLPILRKDFVVDVVQIAEAVVAGADAILAIVAVLGTRTKAILEAANAMNIDVLVEVHDERELEIALQSGADLIGVNNRNLMTFDVDPEAALRVLTSIPKGCVRVAESGIVQPELAHRYYHSGFDAVLIGEALVTSSSPGAFIGACRAV